MRLRQRNLIIVSIWAIVLLAILAGAGWWFYDTRDTRAYESAAEAQVALRMGNLDQARTLLWDAISRKDDVAEFHLLLGRTNFQSGDLAAAYSAYSTANSLDPDNTETLLAVAQLGVQVGQLEASKEATRQLLLRDPQFTPAILLEGIHRMISRDYEEAIEHADRVLAINPADQEAVILKVRSKFLSDDKEGAKELLAQFTDNPGMNAGLAMTELEVYRGTSDAPKMIEVFGKLRGLFPDNNELRLDEAHLHYKLGDSERANEVVIDALSHELIGPQEISTLIRLLRLYADPDEIAEYVSRIREDANIDARIDLARYLRENGKVAEAATLMGGVSGIEARTFEALVDLDQGRNEEALSVANSVLDEDSSHCIAQDIRARALLALDRPRQAIRSGQIATVECPTLPESWSTLARAYDRLNDQTQTERVYEQGIEANPQEPWLTNEFADWLMANDRPREALAVARQIVRVMPAYSPVWERYLSLCREMDPACVRRASEGLEESREILGLDPPPGERATAGLFGRFLIR